MECTLQLHHWHCSAYQAFSTYIFFDSFVPSFCRVKQRAVKKIVSLLQEIVWQNVFGRVSAFSVAGLGACSVILAGLRGYVVLLPLVGHGVS